MLYRHVVHECRHAVGSLVGSEVTVVSSACPCYSFLLVLFQGAKSATQEGRLSRSTFWFSQIYWSEKGQTTIKNTKRRRRAKTRPWFVCGLSKLHRHAMSAATANKSIRLSNKAQSSVSKLMDETQNDTLVSCCSGRLHRAGGLKVIFLERFHEILFFNCKRTSCVTSYKRC